MLNWLEHDIFDHHMISICDFAGRMVTKTIGELYEGATFGDLALIHKTKRSASIVCKGHVPFQNELLLKPNNRLFSNVISNKMMRSCTYVYEWVRAFVRVYQTEVNVSK